MHYIQQMGNVTFESNVKLKPNIQLSQLQIRFKSNLIQNCQI